MAPEQVRGLPVDERVDLFALGAILFELLTGRRAFDRDSRVETLNAILHDDPPPLTNASAPIASVVERIVSRCLEKDPDARFQSARDLAFALDTSAGTATSMATDAGSAAGAASRLPRLALDTRIVAGLLLLVATISALAAWRFARPPEQMPRPLVRFTVQPPPRTTIGDVAISPDGGLLVYSAIQGTTRRLFLRRLDQLDPAPLPGTDGGWLPFFSPDGGPVGFWADGKIKKINVAGSASPIVVCDVKDMLSATWPIDDAIIFASIEQGAQRVHAGGGLPQMLTKPDPARAEIDHHNPQLLPGGKALIFTAHDGAQRFSVHVQVIATGQRKVILESGFDARYLPTGHLVYGNGRSLFAVPFSLDRLELAGTPLKLVDNVATRPRDGYGNFSLSSTGTLVYVPEPSRSGRTLVSVDRAGAQSPLPTGSRLFSEPRVSPDGRRLAVAVTEGERQNIWVYQFGTETFAPVTFEGVNRAPLWTRDGSRLSYSSGRGGVEHLFWQPTDASAPAESLMSNKSGNDLIAGGWAADGRSLAYLEAPPTDNTDIRVLTLEGRRAASVPNIPTRSRWPAVSPDGRWLAFVSFGDINVQPFPGPGVRRQFVQGGAEPIWSHDGRELFFRSRRGSNPTNSGADDDGIFAVPFDGTGGIASAKPLQLFRGRFATGTLGAPMYDAMPDGRRFVIVMASDEEFAPRPLNVVMNLGDELARRVR